MKGKISLPMLGLVVLIMSSLTGPLGSDIQGENSENKDYSSFYAYDKSLPLNDEEKIIVDKETYIVYKVYFDSASGERVPALLSIPKKREKVPCMVFLHGYGGSKEDILSVAELIAAEGYAIIAIDAEFHGERKEEGKELYSPNLNESRKGIIQTIIDLRRTVDYLETRPEIDKEKIGYVGGSMGGIFGAIFIGVEPRIKAAALLVAGGNMSLMIRKSKHYAIPAIRNHLEAEGISYEEIQRFLDPVDPINFIDKFSPRPVVFHLGKYDEIVPAEAGEQLYKKAKEPKKVYWYDSGHNLPLDLVLARVLDFMDQKLLGKKLVFRETKYWISKHLTSILIAVGSILLLAFIGYKIKKKH
jgi:cephalosporin-C deacetylase-like acetyl esterase